MHRPRAEFHNLVISCEFQPSAENFARAPRGCPSPLNFASLRADFDTAPPSTLEKRSSMKKLSGAARRAAKRIHHALVAGSHERATAIFDRRATAALRAAEYIAQQESPDRIYGPAEQ